ncbi:hypothetical protein MCOR27_011590 [Pyricularia oryzae]|uniref:Uncharacterized protein n=3 Tax=Pyricularia TaxID=48558 RepID=A0ABQ8N380_PYRGI|nr:uncharacterized protein MGG_11284 [Pyricularia oryzae 70-15]KAH8837050.1 hypothetical protein MCOR01_010689 [Pyricularia oryzae]KAI6290508.1 hypothetical protein MCOR33_011244 [Pyricularia grisea]EHA54238.1 hypothetical protein MGG_11284 [Pyricularia oryzae 70-15]KAH9438290.1 hypothetical protein MCOR02_001928 [Pyricularia oryzae]KAI6251976.1 hypothetical protein MCOR19_011399 [Pyricularia oryzae]
MVVVLIQARYLDEQPLTNFLTAVFETQYTMIYTRGFFQCVLPRSLNKRERRILRETVQFEGYQEL